MNKHNTMSNTDVLASAKRVFEEEAKAILNLSNLLTHDYVKAAQAIIDSKGRVVVTGLGKSGLIGKKISATMASTGTASIFLHPTEAYHGDLGSIRPGDVIIAIANSGETDELLRLIPFFRRNGNKIISITGNPKSTLSENADFNLNIKVDKEACPLNLAPTASTATTLAMGDALAITLMELRDFQDEDFAKFHPGGSLGRKLLTKVGDVMRSNDLPFVPADISNINLLVKMSEGKLGMALIGTPENLLGVITDGDLRRALVKEGSFSQLNLKDHWSKSPIAVQATDSILEVESLMKQKMISTVVVRDDKQVVGVYQIFN